jgi:hypothetical protein
VRVLVCEPAKAGLVALAPRAGLRRWKTGVRPLSFLLLDVTYGESDVMQSLSVFRQVIQVRGWADSGLCDLTDNLAGWQGYGSNAWPRSSNDWAISCWISFQSFAAWSLSSGATLVNVGRRPLADSSATARRTS